MFLRSSPFKRSTNSVAKLMQQVLLATLPGALALFYYFGWGTLFNVIACSLVAVSCEAAILKLRNRPVKTGLMDYSALVTAVLLGLALPPLAPWWIATIGTIFAIVFAKHLYGGLGFNPFNPAMVGYVLLLISFPVSMTSWLPPQPLAEQAPTFIDSLWLFFNGHDVAGQTLQLYRHSADGFTMATPLDELKTGVSMGFTTNEILRKPMFDAWQSVGWQWVNIGFLLGGGLMLLLRTITWHIPVSYLLSMTVVSGLFNLYDSDQFISPMMHLMSGATMLGAFFIATDPVSAATTPKGKMIFAAGVGLLIVIIRNFGGYPDAVAFAILLMNMTAPLIDHYTQPQVYGSNPAGGSH